MKTTLLFDFTVNKESKTIHVKREFDADFDLIWQAWTEAELLDRWWGPKPWKAETKTMEFRKGGFWHYAMVGPEGEKHWGKANYLDIIPKKFFAAKDGFCDESGVMIPSFAQSLWKTSFISKKNKVQVDITITFDTLTDLEKTIDMGFKEGFTMGLNQLDELLPTL